MMAATQPFISGAISKTVNLPNNASVEDIMEAYIQAWKLGIKAVAVYRDGCKQSQPLSAAGTSTALSKKEDAGGSARATQAAAALEEDLNGPPRAVRHKLKEERMSVTHKFNIGGHEGYIIVGLYPSGEPGEIFIKMAKEGSTVSGLMDSFALAVSIALQHGVPLKLFCEKFAHTRFEPAGGRTIRTSGLPSRSWTTSSGGCRCASSPGSSSSCSKISDLGFQLSALSLKLSGMRIVLWHRRQLRTAI